LRQLRITQILKPEVNVLGDNRRALQSGGGQAHHQKADPMAAQRRQEAKLTF
jgi:hypothetical protein